MARGGAKPGERRGGRRKGVPNKASLERAASLAVLKHKYGEKLAVEIIANSANHFDKLAEKHAADGLEPNPALCDKYRKVAAETAASLAPYETPRLQSTVIAGDADKPLTATLHVHFV